MEIRGNIKDNNLIIEVIGRLSGDYANRAEQLIRELSVGGDYEWTIFDLKGLEYISSAGLRVLMKIYRKNKKLRIVNASPAVYDIFDLTGFTDLMEIRMSEEKSIAEDDTPLNDTSWPVEFKPVSFLFEEQVRKRRFGEIIRMEVNDFFGSAFHGDDFLVVVAAFMLPGLYPMP